MAFLIFAVKGQSQLSSELMNTFALGKQHAFNRQLDFTPACWICATVQALNRITMQEARGECLNFFQHLSAWKFSTYLLFCNGILVY